MLSRLATVFMTPGALLGKFPGQMFKEAHASFTEVTKYIQELRSGAAESMVDLAGKRNRTTLGRHNRYPYSIGKANWI